MARISLAICTLACTGAGAGGRGATTGLGGSTACCAGCGGSRPGRDERGRDGRNRGGDWVARWRWAERELVVADQRRVACPQGCAGGPVKYKGVRIRTVALEVVVVLYARGRAGRLSVVRASTAVGRVGRVVQTR